MSAPSNTRSKRARVGNNARSEPVAAKKEVVHLTLLSNRGPQEALVVPLASLKITLGQLQRQVLLDADERYLYDANGNPRKRDFEDADEDDVYDQSLEDVLQTNQIHRFDLKRSGSSCTIGDSLVAFTSEDSEGYFPEEDEQPVWVSLMYTESRPCPGRLEKPARL